MTNRAGGSAFCLEEQRWQRSHAHWQGQSGVGVMSSVWNSMNIESSLSRSLRL